MMLALLEPRWLGITLGCLAIVWFLLVVAVFHATYRDGWPDM